MLGNLKNPPSPFEDIIRTHFRLKAHAIDAQLDKWLADDDGESTSGHGAQYIAHSAEPKTKKASGSGSEMHKDAQELKALLKTLREEGTIGGSRTGNSSGGSAGDAIIVDDE